MQQSKYSSKTGLHPTVSGEKKTQKYGLEELHERLGLEALTRSAFQPNGTAVALRDEDEDMMDLDDENDVSFVSDMITDHRSQFQQDKGDTIEVEDRRAEQSPGSESPARTVFVVDTNFIISHLNTLEQLRLLSGEYKHLILVPTTVIQELDGLKDSDRFTGSGLGTSHHSQSLGKMARAANDWIYRHMANLDSCLIVQKLNQRYNYNLMKDDAILDCCLYFANNMQKFVVLLSNDKNLCLRALAEHILTVSYRKGMTAELIATKVSEENRSRRLDLAETVSVKNGSCVGDFGSMSAKAYDQYLHVVRECIDLVMRRVFGEDLDFTSYSKDRMTDFVAIGKLINKHYVSVFSERVRGSAIKRDDWLHLPKELTSLPSNPIQLTTFVTFWSKVIQDLSDEDTAHLWQFCQQWQLRCATFN